MELCGGLLLAATVLFIFAGLGHAVWLVGAAILRALFGDAKPVPPPWEAGPRHARSKRRRCVRCDTPFPPHWQQCPECGLDPGSDVADDLRDLEITARGIQALKASGSLDADLAEKVYLSIEKGQTLLLKGKPLKVVALAREDQPRQPWTLLDRLLQAQVDQMSFPDRKEALRLGRDLDDRDFEKLSAQGLWHLAQLMSLSGLTTRALTLYDLLLVVYPNDGRAGTAALEAATLAKKQGHFGNAARFVHHALKSSLTIAEKETAGTLLALLAEAPGAEIAHAKSARAVEAFPVELAAREAVPVAAEPVAAVASAEPEPRRTFAEMLAGFMETRNILWGELVGGLLIVGCSIALVISLWQTLEAIPYFPFLIFASITFALFGAGLYTLTHWKLEATSRGLLVIANLLVPLDFLVLAGLAREEGPLAWCTNALALAGFLFLVWRSAQVLAGGLMAAGPIPAAWLLALSMVGTSAAQLVMPRWVPRVETNLSLFVSLSLAPVVLQGLAAGLVMLGLRKSQKLESNQAQGLFLFLGQTTFAVGVALGFIVYRSDHSALAFQHLAVPIAVAGLPLLLCGVHVSKKLEESTADEVAHQDRGAGLTHSLTQVIGTVIAGVGLLILVAALGLAWPRPLALLVIGLLNSAVVGALAFGYRLPGLHAVALPCLAVAFLIGFHLVRGALPHEEQSRGMLALAISPASGVGWILLAGLLAGAAEFLVRTGRKLDGIYHVIAGGVAAALALALVAQTGAHEPGRGMIVFGLFALGTLAVNGRWRQPWASWAASVGLLSAFVFFYLWIAPVASFTLVWLLALLTHATVMHLSGLIGTLLLARQGKGLAFWQTVYDAPFLHTGLITSLLAVTVLCQFLDWTTLTAAMWFCSWIAALWLLAAWREGWPGWWAAGQGVATIALLCGLSAWLVEQPWIVRDGLGHLWDWQVYGVGLGCLCVGWIVLRRALGRFPRFQVLLNPGWPTLDWITLGILVLGQLILAAVPLSTKVFIEQVPQGGVLLDPLPPLMVGPAWALWGILAAILLWHRESKYAQETVFGLLLLGVAVPMLLAHPFAEQRAAASAYRWAASFCFLGYSGLLWNRAKVGAWAQKLGWTGEASPELPRGVRSVMLVMLVLPVLMLTIWVAWLGLAGDWPAGPMAGSVFKRMGIMPSMMLPLLVILLAFVGHGVREDSAGFVFSAGLILLASVPGGYALGLPLIDELEMVFMLQLAAATAANWLLVWLATGWWRSRLFLLLQLGEGVAALFGVLVPALVVLLLSVSKVPPPLVEAAGHWLGWAGLASTLAAGIWIAVQWGPGWAVHAVGFGGLGLGILASCVLADATGADGWRGYHVLTLAGTLLGLLLVSASWTGSSVSALGPMFWSPERRTLAAEWLGKLFPPTWTRRWVEAMSLSVVLLALGGAWGDPAQPYWSCAATLLISVLLGAVAVWSGRPGYVYVSGLLLNMMAYLIWQSWLVHRWGLAVWLASGPGIFDLFLLLQILAFALGSATWTAVEGFLRRREPPLDVRGRFMPYAHMAALAAAHLFALLTLVGLAGDVFRLEISLEGYLPWIALLATSLSLGLLSRDAEARAWGMPGAPLYSLGLAALALAMHQLDLQPRDVGLWGGVVLGVFFLAHCGVAFWQKSVGRLTWWPGANVSHWFLAAQGLVALSALCLGWWMALNLEHLSERMMGPLAAALVLAGTWMLATTWSSLVTRENQTDDGSLPMFLTYAVLAVAGTEFCWALVDPAAAAAPWLERNAVELVFLAVCGVTLWLAVPRLLSREAETGSPSRWSLPAWLVGQIMLWSAAALLVLFLMQEFALYDKAARHTPLPLPLVLMVLGLLLVIVAGFIVMAASRRCDPIGLSERGQVRFVWLAELLVGVALVHCRLNIPEIFPFKGHHWPMIVLALGFLFVGMGELFRRLRLPMLAEPAHVTGLVAPLLPIAAFVVRPIILGMHLEQLAPGIDPFLNYLRNLPGDHLTHAFLWFMLGLLYLLVAVLRRQSTFAFLGALAGNFGLWVLFAHTEALGFLLHPQLWLAPLGIILLAAERVHHERLSADQRAGVRYLGLVLIYVSSSADMFIAGLTNWWLPLILAVLSVAGVLLGILLRVRAFLFMGVSFLFLVIFAQIWHAAVDLSQTWLWWACGIVLGAAILALFALFEKRRNDVLKIVEDIKQWR